MSTYKSIKETGAKPGDKVVCEKVWDESLEPCRYTSGRIYTVVDWFGRPCVNGNSHGKVCGAGDSKWLIAFEGYGAEWRLA